jgi:hypothetical protein
MNRAPHAHENKRQRLSCNRYATGEVWPIKQKNRERENVQQTLLNSNEANALRWSSSNRYKH